mmetsp:Transcript_42294/g.86296  ORF Transcript_42294/g.86296 Transcript_42294/m.86296 type:complete len:206 (+) Transcript_42294:39-656(+)
MSISLLCTGSPFGYHPLRAQSLFWLLLLATFASADLAAERIDSVRAAKLQEIELDLQDIRRHNSAMSKLLKVPFSKKAAHALTLEAQAEKRAEQRLVKVMSRADAEVAEVRGFRNTTNATATDVECSSQHSCSWWESLKFQLVRHQAFVIVGLLSGVLICLCGFCWEFRRKSTDGLDMEIGTDDLDEVWFRKPQAQPSKRSSLKR